MRVGRLLRTLWGVGVALGCAGVLVPLYLLLPLLTSHHHPHLHLSSPSPRVTQQVLDQDGLDQLEQVDLHIIILTFDRPHSLARCLRSLLDARFLGDRVGIEIRIDRGEDGQVDSETLRVAEEFRHPRAAMRVVVCGTHEGLLGQWLHAWNPRPDSHEIAVIVEDDISLSPHFYRWLKAVHNFYSNNTRINGVALQGWTMKHALRSQGRVEAPPGQPVFLYPFLGTWGFSPKPGHWHHFLAWQRQHSQDSSFLPMVPGIRPTLWFQRALRRGRAHTMWSMWHLCHAWTHHHLTLYPNLPMQAGLAVNWREEGLHFSSRKQRRHHRHSYFHTVKPDVLLTEWNESFVDFPTKPVMMDEFGTMVEEALG